MDRLTFPDGFLFGAATSAHQIEGGRSGRGESIWDRYEATPGHIADGSNAGVACDHYHRWREDIELMGWLGIGSYRFSIAWPRVLPLGRGKVNAAGLDFYDALVDSLLERNIQPFVTLYHWDLPQALQDLGGWSVRDTVGAFVDYAEVVAARLGDRVRHWITHNEPWCIAVLGHEEGVQAPGHRDPVEAMRVAHHVLLSHGRATEVIRQNAPGAEVGISLILFPGFPATPDPADADATRQYDGAFNRWYLDPVFRGRYPEDAVADRIKLGQLSGPDLPFVHANDLGTISSPIDFLGVNYYSRSVLKAGENGRPVTVRVAPEDELTDMGWEVFPQGLHDILVRVAREYKPPRIYITESGAAYADGPDEAGRIADTRRIDYLRGHLTAARQAIADGVPLSGYFAWSLLDNFEWSHGYERRFGLCWVDFETQERMPKDSAFWYRDVIAANAVNGNRPGNTSRRNP